MSAVVDAGTPAAAPVASPGVTRVLLADPRGFCAGVEMAIKALAWLVELVEPPVYCYHEIVHNRAVVEVFERAGVVFVDDIAEVPAGAAVVLSAHGSAPEVVAEATARASVVVNAVCPLVAKVHHEVKVRAGHGYQIVYVGHSGHDEAIGTMAVAPDAVHLVEDPADVAALDEPGVPVALLSQTTLGMGEWADVRAAVLDRFGDVWTPGRGDLCFATTNRQGALRALADRVDAVIVIGSQSSSNTNALERLARECGVTRIVRIETADDLPADLTGVVGVTAGASVPEQLVDDVLNVLDPADGVEAVRVTDEDEYFPLPAGLRSRLPADVLAADRHTSASDALARLASRVAATP